MTATTTTVLHPVAPARSIALEQFWTVWLALRKARIAFLGILGLLLLLTILRATDILPASGSRMTVTQTTRTPNSTQATRTSNRTFNWSWGVGGGAAVPDSAPAQGATSFSIHLGYWPPGTFVTMLIGLFLPFGIWRSEDPSRRTYHWTMPIARAPHTLLKMLAGWVWLMAAVAVYMGYHAVQFLLLAHTPGAVGAEAHLLAWQWAIPYVAATVVYLLSSLVVIASDHPWRWIGGIPIAYGIALGFLSAPGLAGVRRALIDVWLGSYGLYTVICGIGFDHFVEVMTRTLGHLPPPTTADFVLWLKAAALWTVMGGVGVCAAAYRRPEQ